MSNRFILIQSDPLADCSNAILLFYSPQEPSKLFKKVQSSYAILKQDTIYTFYQSPFQNLIAIIINPASSYSEYSLSFESIIPWFITNYGKSLTFILPESDNLQSISMGLFQILNKYVSEDIYFKLYTEPDQASILKPMIENSQFLVSRQSAKQTYLKNYFNCSQCGKFPYIPKIKTCCNQLVCVRCAERDISKCKNCAADLIVKDPGAELTEFCRNAPYICKCGIQVIFKDIDQHIAKCIKAEVECRVCKEMTKLSNFTAHFRINHLDLLIKLLEEPKF